MSRRWSKGKGKGEFARDETRILASRVSLARAYSSLRPLLPSACYAGYANSLLPPCFLVNYFFSLQTVSLFSIFTGMHQSSWKKGSTFTFQSKQTDAGEKLHTLFQAAAMSRKNKLSNVQKWWTKAHLYIHSVSSFVVIYSLRYCFTPQVLRDSFIGENSKTCMVRFDCEWSFRDLDHSP